MGPPPHNGGTKCRWGMKKLLFRPVSRIIACRNSCNRLDVINTVLQDRGKLVTVISGSSTQRSLLMTGDDDEVFMTRSLVVMPKTREQHLIVCSGKSKSLIIDECAQLIALLKVASDRYKTLCGLSVTAELQFDFNIHLLSFCLAIHEAW